MTDNAFKYWAFLSYSQQDNGTQSGNAPEAGICWGDWLREALKSFSTPADFAGHVNARGENTPERIDPIFQDESESADNGSFSAEVREALEQSRYLVVICSPRSAKSLHVNEAVRQFKQLGRGNRILPMVIAGEPNASDGSKPGVSADAECFVPAMLHPVNADGTLDTASWERGYIFADARFGPDKREVLAKDQPQAETGLEIAKIQLVAGLIGVGFNGLLRREQNRRFAGFAEAQQQAREAQARLAETQNKFEEAQKQVQTLQGQTRDALSQLEEARQQVRAAQNQVLEIQNLPQDVKSQIQDAQNRAMAAQQQAGEAQRQVVELQGQAHEAQRQLETARLQLGDSQKQLEAARSQVRAAEGKVLAAQTQARVAESQAEEARNQAREIQSQLELARAQSAETLPVVTEKLSEEFTLQLQAAQQRARQAQDQVQALQEQVQAAQAQLEQARSQAQATQGELETARHQAVALENKVLEAQAQARNAEGQAEEVRQQMREAQSQLELARTQAREAQDKVLAVQDLPPDVHQQIQEAQNKVQEAQQQAAALHSQLEAARTQAQEAQNNLLAAQNQARETQRQLAQTREQIQNTEDQLKTARARAIEVESKAGQAQAEARQAKSEAEAAHSQAREAQSQAEAARRQTREAESKFQDLQTQNQNIQRQMQESTRQARAAGSQAEELENKTRAAQRLTRVFAVLAVLALLAAGTTAGIALRQPKVPASVTATQESKAPESATNQLDQAQIRQALQDLNTAPGTQFNRWDELAARIPSEEIPGALKTASVILDDRQRTHFLKQLVTRWSAENPQSAITNASAIEGKIVSETGSVDSSLYLELAVLGNWAKSDLPGALNWARQLPDAGSRQRAFETIIPELTAENLTNTLATLNDLQPAPSELLYTRLFQRWASVAPAQAIEQRQQIPGHDADGKVLSAILTVWRDQQPETALGWLKAQTNSDALAGGAWRDAMIADLFKGWAAKDLDAATAACQQLPEDTAKEKAWEYILNQKIASAPAAAAESVTNLPAGDYRQQAIAALSGRWATTDAPAALAWAQALPLSGERTAAINQVLVNWAPKDPPAAAQAASQQPDVSVAALGKIAATWTKTDLTATTNWVASLPEGDKKNA
ncbi:MAG TPA: TIR domain-containing protein, partial [Verrucomicrobiae bacterium]